MDQAVSLVNFATSALLSALAAWAVISPQVKDGIIVKIGLVLLSFGHALAAMHLFDGIEQSDLLGLSRARFVSNAGMLVVVAGYWFRYYKGERLMHILPKVLGIPLGRGKQ